MKLAAQTLRGVLIGSALVSSLNVYLLHSFGWAAWGLCALIASVMVGYLMEAAK